MQYGKPCAFIPYQTEVKSYSGYRAILILLLSVCLFQAFGQDPFVDSLKRRLETEESQDTIVSMYVNLGDRLRVTDTVEAWRCHSEVIKIVNQTNNEFYRAQAYFLEGKLHLGWRPAQAAVAFANSIDIFLKYPDNRRAILYVASNYINIGLVHYQGGDYQTAIDYYLRAEDMHLRHDPESGNLAVVWSNISIAYGTINKTDEALIYSKKGLDLARKKKDPTGLMYALYAHGGNLVNARKEGTDGIVMLDSAKQLGLAANNLYYIFYPDWMKAMYYYNTKQYQRAIEYYTICLNLAKKYNSTAEIGNAFLNISANEAELKMPRQAAAHLDSAAKYLDIKTNSTSKQLYYENYAEVYKQLGNFTKAFAFKDSVGVIKDSVYNADNIRQLQFRNARFNYEKKQNEIVQLEAERKLQELSIREKNTLNYILIGTAGAFVIIFILSYRNYRQKQALQEKRISELETEKKLTATEAVLKGEEQERTRLAKDLHDGLGGMLSGIKYAFNTMKGNLIMTPDNSQAFERSMDMLDSSIKELRRVAHNMMPEALVKFGLDVALKDYCNDINQNGGLEVSYQSIDLADANPDQTTSITIYRIVQELISNALKHAGARKVIVQITKTQGHLAVTVEDDGKGFDPMILKQSKGIGWTNIQHRVEFLKGKVDVNSQINKGTSVYIEFNV